MNCPNCNKQLNNNIKDNVNFCPFCGAKLFEAGKDYLITIACAGQRHSVAHDMMVFVDDSELYKVKPGESICFSARAGFHNLKFRHNIRNKSIQLLLSSDYDIKANYNTLTGLIETNVTKVDPKDVPAAGRGQVKLTKPEMVSQNGGKDFDVLLGEDEPEIEIRATSGFKEGILRLYSERLEFTSDTQLKKEVVLYKTVSDVRKKMGSVDIQCEGNVHKIYSIPKDSYNEVIAFLTNRIEATRGF
ncbi:zinc ribbon domain-containing protein [Butyrivibrio proteoclasticus]|uniref:zinc ribbon domain-containing protein n=1 Tax=Butyrivibrio proteoclasticus TaxID=43305 RepID=UPI00047D9BD8|nr:zinc ribbon domain-containing protein [Butyrivibrio proteoclasticus]